MKLEKTGQVVKVDPSYIIPMWQFSKDIIRWEPGEYLRCIGKEDVNWGSIVSVLYDAKIKPDFILFPVYRYSSIIEDTMAERLGIEFKYEDRIKIENLSLFNVYRVIENADPEVDITVIAGITAKIMADYDVETRLYDVGVDFKIGSNRNYNSTTIYWGLWYDRYLKTLWWAKGRKYSDFSYKPKFRSKVVDHLYTIEIGMFAFINFLYTLYTGGGLKDNTVEYKLFKPYMELLRSYGNTFEEAIATLKEMFVLVGW
jgi:hypothetical protein